MITVDSGDVRFLVDGEWFDGVDHVDLVVALSASLEFFTCLSVVLTPDGAASFVPFALTDYRMVLSCRLGVFNLTLKLLKVVDDRTLAFGVVADDPGPNGFSESCL